MGTGGAGGSKPDLEAWNSTQVPLGEQLLLTAELSHHPQSF